MAITAELVRDLRERTGAGMMECKKALVDSNGDMDKAIEALRVSGLAKAEKKAGRVAAEGACYAYIHGDGKIGVLAEINCETDFVAKTEQFRELCKDIAMHIAAAAPQYVLRNEVPAATVEKEKAVFLQQILESGKPREIAEKIVDGKLNKFYQEVCLMEQPFVKDPAISIEQMIKASISKTGENITVRRFARFVLGEGIEKKTDNLADEVAKLTHA